MEQNSTLVRYMPYDGFYFKKCVTERTKSYSFDASFRKDNDSDIEALLRTDESLNWKLSSTREKEDFH